MSEDWITHYIEHGYAVIPGILNEEQVEEALISFHQHLLKYIGIDPDHLKPVESFAGFVDAYWAPWKMKINSHPKFLNAFRKLFCATFGAPEAENPNHVFHSPFAPFDGNRLFYYIDRANFRLPDSIRKASPLVLHVDCDPLFQYELFPKGEEKLKQAAELCNQYMNCVIDSQGFSDNREIHYRWRPIQSFIALTDNLEGDLGGFMAVPGSFKIIKQVGLDYHSPQGRNPFVPLNSSTIKDKAVNVRYKKGDLVVWDWRTGHTNNPVHSGSIPRQVIYCQVIPDVPVNRLYAQMQRRAFENGLIPPDFAPLCKIPDFSVFVPKTSEEFEMLGYDIPEDDISAVIARKPANSCSIF
jgi:hypothetical protein